MANDTAVAEGGSKPPYDMGRCIELGPPDRPGDGVDELDLEWLVWSETIPTQLPSESKIGLSEAIFTEETALDSAEAITEDNPDSEWHLSEEYARSLRPLEKLGQALVELTVNDRLDKDEVERLTWAFRENWESSLIEMLNTDQQFREKLEVTRTRTYDVHEGRVLFSDSEGKAVPAVEVIARGAEASARTAETEPSMRFQAKRDAGDLSNAQAVDAMPPGTLRLVVSMDPKKALAQNKSFAEGLGYRSGWGSIQGYLKHASGDQLTALTHTFHNSKTAVMRDLCNKRGAVNARGEPIPADVDENDFISFAVEIPCETVEDARAYIENLRDESYEAQGITGDRYSVDEFFAQNKHVVDQIFETQVIPLAEALGTKRKSTAIHEFAKIIHDGGSRLRSEVRARLGSICNRDELDREDVKLLEELIRYATVEQLRPALKHLGSKQPAIVESFATTTTVLPQESIATRLAGGAVNGIRAGRSYGGCTASKLFDNDNALDTSPSRNPLDAFGGTDEPEEEGTDRNKWKKKKQRCVVKVCPNSRKVVECGPCGVCMERCQSMYDSGNDPTKLPEQEEEMAEAVDNAFAEQGISSFEQAQRDYIED